MLEEPHGPALVLPETTDRSLGFTTSEVAERLGETESERARLVTQVRGLVRRCVVEPVAIYTGDGRGAFLFDDAALLTAAVAGAFYDHNLSDRAAMAAVALTLNRFVDTAPPLLHTVPREARSPAEWLVDQWRCGVGGWFLDLATLRDANGNSISRARLRHVGGPSEGKSYGFPFRAGEGYEIRAVTCVALDGPLSKLFGVPRAPGALN